MLNRARASRGGPRTASSQPAIRRPRGSADARRGIPVPVALLVGDDHDVHVAAAADHAGAGTWQERGAQPPAAGLADHDVAGVHPAGELQDRVGWVFAQDVVEGAAQGLDQGALAQQGIRCAVGQAIPEADVQGQQLTAGPGVRDPGSTPDQGLTLGPPRQGDHHALPCGPRVGDLVVSAIALQGGVDAVGDPEQRQFAQRGQVAHAEEVGQGGVYLLGAVHVAVGKPAAQGLRAHVHEFDLVGGAHHVVGDCLLLADPGDRLDDVVQRFQVLDVHRGDHVDARVEQGLDVLTALGVPRAGDVGVGQFVDQGHLWSPGQEGGQVHLGERRPTMLDGPPGHQLQTLDQLCGVLPAVGLHEADHHVRPSGQAPVALGEHVVGLAHARGRAHVHAQGAAPLGRPARVQRHRRRARAPRAAIGGGRSTAFSLSDTSRPAQRIEGQVELEHVDPRLAEEPQHPSLGVLADQC